MYIKKLDSCLMLHIFNVKRTPIDNKKGKDKILS